MAEEGDIMEIETPSAATAPIGPIEMDTVNETVKREEALMTRYYMGTSLEDLRGSDELSLRFAKIQAALGLYNGSGVGEFFGRDMRVNKAITSRIHFANREKIPDVALIKICVGGTVFLANQRFYDLHPYSQQILRALHGLDLSKPMCKLPEEEGNLERWDEYWQRRNQTRQFLDDTLTLFHMALVHLSFLLQPNLERNEGYELYNWAMVGEVHEALKRHLIYDSLGRPTGETLWDLTQNDLYRDLLEGHSSREFTRLARCPSQAALILPDLYFSLSVGQEVKSEDDVNFV